MSTPETNGGTEAAAAEKEIPLWLTCASIVPVWAIILVLIAYMPWDLWKITVVLSGHSALAVAVGVLWMLGSLLLFFVVIPPFVRATLRGSSNRRLRDYPRELTQVLAVAVVTWLVIAWLFQVAWRVEITRKPEVARSQLQTPLPPG